MKVYELAKEFGIKSTELVQTMKKEWKIPVRSYMEVLTEDVEKAVRKKIKLSQEKETAKKETKKVVKKVVRKKVVKKAASKVVVKKEEPMPSSEKKEEPPSRNIIRRKAFEVKQIIEQKESEEKAQEVSPQESAETSTQEEQHLSLKDKLREINLPDEKAAEEEKRKEKKAGDAKEAPVQKFKAADFRKREVVFQPKKKKSALLGQNFKKTQVTTPKGHKRVIKFYNPVTVQELALQMKVKSHQLLNKLKQEGMPADKQTVLDIDIISLIAPEFGFEIKNQQKTFKELIEELKYGDTKSAPISCPPVVTVMGHVDHGKTTLLDHFRKTKVVEKEAGGITQHIGAYNLPVGSSFITFIDTPGHEAFAEMRARGAQITNIVVIVVAADDGVNSQTEEAIKHAQSAKVPIIVAINKMDKPNADPEKVKQQMSKYNLVPEEWGGDVIFVPISALKGDGTKELLEQISLVAEMQEIKANPKQSAQGVIIESRMEKGRGWIATVIVKNGTLKKSDNIMTESLIGRIRQMVNDQGQNVQSAGPGFPVEISGFEDAPKAGDLFFSIENDKEARQFLLAQKQKGSVSDTSSAPTAEELLNMHTNKLKELALIIKADVGGSLEAIKNSLSKITSDEIKINVIHSGLGGITESDVLLATTSQAEIIGFNVRPDSKTEKLAQTHNIPIWNYSIIYELLDGVKKRAIGALDPSIVDEDWGKAEVREVFNITGAGAIAGSYVTSGKIGRHNLARLVRDGRVVYEGKLDSLKRFKDDAKQVEENFECGIGLENFNDIKVGDVIETYVKKEIARTDL